MGAEGGLRPPKSRLGGGGCCPPSPFFLLWRYGTNSFQAVEMAFTDMGISLSKDFPYLGH